MTYSVHIPAQVSADNLRMWPAIHYGHSFALCGAPVRDDDVCITVIDNVRCMECLEELNRPV